VGQWAVLFPSLCDVVLPSRIVDHGSFTLHPGFTRSDIHTYFIYFIKYLGELLRIDMTATLTNLISTSVQRSWSISGCRVGVR